ncbi:MULTISPECIES: DNA methyltransferase [unclassified Mesorhizobium]|uniref:DNA methyltransferase n=1 Tax=unclassified Mesorhizobium TaxID=325217 RepID=UPI00112BF0D8|nr:MULTISPECIES: DNA methyltransferase [unclassified Mesorhizobium]MCA0027363.1 site-specific DNA-methyltransferase [Mesorhizobium sp. B263B1A]TPJ98637.1 site-specific DNA-methyltransferase [Mesorhizobium sp. B2-5-12]TPK28800.1 site-specific DNA-methyltransferase [Mesorhizobium sp. B2-5-6]
MTAHPDYSEFLKAKVRVAPSLGFEVDPASVNPLLKPMTQAIVPWACRGGRRALFLRFGLHKTSTQIEILRQSMMRAGGHALQVVPLGVKHEFFLEQANRHPDVELKFVNRPQQMEEPNKSGPGRKLIHLTNYETIRDGKLDPCLFTAAALDEAAVLRGFGGTKTFREFMATFAGDDRTRGVKHAGVRYRFVATAIPDPNEYIELLAYAAFLGVMDVGEAKTRFFKRDSTKADRLTLHPHKEDEFWLWVSTWALFVQMPSDLGFSDEGYELPPIDVRWHEIPSDHSAAGAEKNGQGRMFADAAHGVVDAAREKKRSLDARVDKMLEIRAEDPTAHRILWHDLEVEREAIQKAIPTVRSVWGNLDPESKEERVVGFARGEFPELSTKPVLNGSGCNFQEHCWWNIYLGIGFKFHDFFQSLFRTQRYGQLHPVRADLIYTEAERGTRRELERKWREFEAQAAKMSAIIRKHGLAEQALAGAMKRSLGVERREVRGDNYLIVHNDTVEETRSMADDSVDLIVTSIPFSTQYEYTPSFNDFGHTDSDAHFWAQMDFLTPQLLRVLKPGRRAVIHVKDRIVPGGINGFGFQTVSPFSDDCCAHFRRHGFAFLSRVTIGTDVVRENNQTYRLGWTEQCKDGTRMGHGMPEYLLEFRKPQTDRSRGYADEPVVKAKPDFVSIIDHQPIEPGDDDYDSKRVRAIPGTGYSRGRWQLDAHGVWRSSGNRPLLPDELASLIKLSGRAIYRGWKKFCQDHVYNHALHVEFCEQLDEAGRLPPTFMIAPPHVDHPAIRTDVARMRTLNMLQKHKGREMHLCPLQFDIVDRAIEDYSMPGEMVFDPFGGIMTVPYCALRMGRKAIGVELNPDYFADGVTYAKTAAAGDVGPGLLDLIEAETLASEPENAGETGAAE